MKKITSFLLSFLFSVCMFAQDKRLWGTYYGSTATDFGYSVATDASGNVYMTGYTNDNSGKFGSGGFQNSSGGGNDAYLVKFDANGTRLWSTYFGGTGDDQGYNVAVDGNGDVYLSGQTSSSSNIASNGAFQTIYGGGTYDAFLAKFNSAGNLLWSTYFGDAGDDEGRAVTIDALGNVSLVGRTTSTNNIATGGALQTAYGGGTYDAFVSQFDLNGNQLWATYYGDANDDEGLAITSDGTGNIYFTGVTGSNSNMTTGGAYQTTYGGGTYDGLIVALDVNGNLLWATYYGGSGQDEGRGIKATAGNLYLAGRTASASGIASGGAFQTTFGGVPYDAFLVRFDFNGNLK